MPDPTRRETSGVDPDFGGHLEKPPSEMTMRERLDWLWEMYCLQELGGKAQEGRGAPMGADRCDEASDGRSILEPSSSQLD